LERVTVPIPGRSYETTIGAGLIDDAVRLLPELGDGTRAFVVVDRALADTWLPRLGAALEAGGLHHVPLTVPSGEEAKSMQVFGTLLHQLASQEAHRDDVVIALGGGTVGDLAGFVASTYMRGVRLVQVPTTLIGQVDAAIGGKTAVNLPEGKNLVGTFYQPLAVLCDVTTLSTLPDRDYRSGLGEVAKYALALEPELLELLEGDRRRGRARRRREDVPELRAHAGARPGTARGVRRPLARRGDRGRDGLRRQTGRVARACRGRAQRSNHPTAHLPRARGRRGASAGA
jgi:3-dehydroquinate synthase